MKNVFILVGVVILLTSFVSSEIIISQQLQPVYNLGSVVPVPIVVKTTKDSFGSLDINLICNGQEINFYKNGVSLFAGEEKNFDSSLVLSKSTISGITGTCKIKAIFGTEYILSNEFIISDKISVSPLMKSSEIFPKESIVIFGTAAQEGGKSVDGFVEAKIFYGNPSPNNPPIVEQLATVANGIFSLNVTAPNDMKAGAYIVQVKAYERGIDGEITNQGLGETALVVKQLPTNLEILLEKNETDPGRVLKLKTILHDQTGDAIKSNVSIIVKDAESTLRDKVVILNGDFYEFLILNNEPSQEFTVFAESEGIISETKFKVNVKADVSISLVNRTLVIKNSGNVLYCNKSVVIKIGNESTSIPICLEIGKEKKYTLEGPEGEQEIKVLAEENEVSGTAIFPQGTGGVVSIKEATGSITTLTRHTFIWFFVILIIGFVAFTIFRKGYKRSFIGGEVSPRKKQFVSIPPKTSPAQQKPAEKISGAIKELTPIGTKNKAELSLSIQGDKQNVSVICLNIKNLAEIESKKGSAKETLQKIVDNVEVNKAVTYESQENIFFILAPSRTRTMKNEMTSIELTRKIIQALKSHNQKFNERIKFGLSLNYGTIVAKQEVNAFKFMSMGSLVGVSKKLASMANEEVFLSDKFKEKLEPGVKAEKQNREGLIFYVIKEIKEPEDHKKFLSSFMQRNK